MLVAIKSFSNQSILCSRVISLAIMIVRQIEA